VKRYKGMCHGGPHAGKEMVSEHPVIRYAQPPRFSLRRNDDVPVSFDYTGEYRYGEHTWQWHEYASKETP
jgi:hypothetical protein